MCPPLQLEWRGVSSIWIEERGVLSKKLRHYTNLPLMCIVGGSVEDFGLFGTRGGTVFVFPQTYHRQSCLLTSLGMHFLFFFFWNAFPTYSFKWYIFSFPSCLCSDFISSGFTDLPLQQHCHHNQLTCYFQTFSLSFFFVVNEYVYFLSSFERPCLSCLLPYSKFLQ